MGITVALNKPYFQPTVAQITEKFNHTPHSAHTHLPLLSTGTVIVLCYEAQSLIHWGEEITQPSLLPGFQLLCL